MEIQVISRLWVVAIMRIAELLLPGVAEPICRIVPAGIRHSEQLVQDVAVPIERLGVAGGRHNRVGRVELPDGGVDAAGLKELERVVA
jgi:hypothetical protein